MITIQTLLNPFAGRKIFPFIGHLPSEERLILADPGAAIQRRRVRHNCDEVQIELIS
jgi:hypothetical protein